jgi:CheY-like chemotaxis protein
MTKEPALEHPAPRNARSPMKTWRILFLDSAENIQQLKAACKDVGYTVVGAVTIEQAWAFLDGKDHADVIVCAAYLEEESMFEFLKGVRESEVHANAMFLILALEPGGHGARLHRSTEGAAKAFGADTYAIMPVFDPHALVELIKTLQPSVPTLQQSATEAEKRRAE